MAGGEFPGGVAYWTGSAWQTVGGGTSGIVRKLVEHQGDLIAGGTFTSAGGTPANRVARWDGSNWQAMGQGVPHTVRSLCAWGDGLVATDSANFVPSFYYWDGLNWTSLPNNLFDGARSSTTANDLAVYNGDLYVTGSFNQPGWGLARLRPGGKAWERLGRGMNHWVFSSAVHQGKLVMGGPFTTAGDIDDASRIVAWDGQNYQKLGKGFSGSVYAVQSFRGELIAGGFFTHADGQQVNAVARWDGKEWHDMAGGITGSLNGGPAVLAMVEYQGDLIAAGLFTTAGGEAASCIARWDGTRWQEFGGGVNNTVEALAIYNGDLIAAGIFSTAGGVPCTRIARWDGTTWHPLGAGVNARAYALHVYNGHLIVGGDFTQAGGLNIIGLARWNGTSWSGLGAASLTKVYAITEYNGDLVVGGSLFQANSNNVARWRDGVWLNMGSGVELDVVETLSVYKNELIVGGRFIKAGGQATGYFARWRPTCARGDMNCDAAVDLADVDGFVAVLLAPDAATDCQKYLADADGDGLHTGLDVTAFVAATGN